MIWKAELFTAEVNKLCLKGMNNILTLFYSIVIKVFNK